MERLDHIKKLYQLYLNGKISKVQEVELMEFIHKSSDVNLEEVLGNLLEKNEEETINRQDLSNRVKLIFEKINLRTNGTNLKTRRTKVVYLKWFSVAAVLVFVGIFTFLKVFDRKEIILQGSSITKTQKILPGGNRATIRLSNGDPIQLSEDKEEIVSMGLNLAYADGETVQTSKLDASFATIFTPRGGQYRIVLPDGSRVWLNSETSLTYPLNFDTERREVSLVGEAYFEIKHVQNESNERVPFIVKTKQQVIEVLGTHFNIKAYENEHVTKTTLLEGSVRVNSTENMQAEVLQPGQQGVSIESNKTIRIQDVDVTQVVAWKNGLFSFRNSGIKGVMRQFERWYDIDVEYIGEIPKATFSGKIYRSAQIDKVYDLLDYYGVGYEVDGRKIRIKTTKKHLP